MLKKINFKQIAAILGLAAIASWKRNSVMEIYLELVI